MRGRVEVRFGGSPGRLKPVLQRKRTPIPTVDGALAFADSMKRISTIVSMGNADTGRPSSKNNRLRAADEGNVIGISQSQIKNLIGHPR
jgi:hypothetical protein